MLVTKYCLICTMHGFVHLRSPRLLCVRSLSSPWYDYVYFNSASSSLQWVVSLLLWLTKLSVLNVSHYATMNNKTSVNHNWRCFKSWYVIGRIESVRVQSDKVLKIQKINAMCGNFRNEALPREDGFCVRFLTIALFHCCNYVKSVSLCSFQRSILDVVMITDDWLERKLP